MDQAEYFNSAELSMWQNRDGSTLILVWQESIKEYIFAEWFKPNFEHQLTFV